MVCEEGAGVMSEDFMCYKREFDYYECSGCGCWKECYNLPAEKEAKE